MFIATQSSTESSILLQTAVHTSDTSDETFLNNHELNMNNICMDVNRWKICMDTLNTHETKVYSCGLDMVEVIMGIEEEFGLKIEDSEISEIKTVGDIVKKIENKRLGR
jgi:acyl carrier protein